MSSVVDNVRFNFLYIDTYSFGRNWVFPESRIPYNMLRYIESGVGTFFIDDDRSGCLYPNGEQIVLLCAGRQLFLYQYSLYNICLF